MEDPERPYPLLTCPKPHHSTQPLMFVCLDTRCDNHIPICYACKKETHSKHITEDIGFFFKRLQEQASSKDLKEVESLLFKLGNMRQYCVELIQKEKEKVQQLFERMEVLVGQSCESLTERITSEASKLRESIHANARSCRAKNYDEFCQVFELCVGNFHRNLLCEKELFNEAFLLIRNIEGCSHSVEQSLRKISEEVITLNDKLTKAFSMSFQFSFDRLFPTVSDKYVWSEKLKFRSIDLENYHAQIGKDMNILARGLLTPKFIKEQVGVLMVNELAEGKHLAYSWKVKVAKLQYTINFGMCLRSKAITAEFQRKNWENVDHGHYLIGQDKIVYSHSDAQVNGKPLSFEFNKEEVISIYYDTVTHIITFSKGDERFEMSVLPAGEGDCYHPCAYLTRTDNIFKNGESVEIIQNSPT